LRNPAQPPFFHAQKQGEQMMKKTRILRLMKQINGIWRVVDYGVPSKAAVYIAMGYQIEQPTRIKEK
jgi:hypothetical protein